MWQRFTEHARKAIFLAQQEAGKLGESHVSTEHILLGICREPECGAARVLSGMGMSVENVRSEVERQITRSARAAGADMQLTPRAKRVIDLAYDEARAMNHNSICTEHLLLGLIRENEGVAGRVLNALGADIAAARQIVADIMGTDPARAGVGSAYPMPPGGLEESNARTPMANLRKAAIAKPQGVHVQSGFGKLSVEDLSSIGELTAGDIRTIFTVTKRLKDEISLDDQQEILRGKTLAMIFEKPSLRTRVSFETGIFQLGGHGIYLAPSDISLGKRESVADVAHNLERMVDIIMARVFEHEKITELAKHSRVPVINALSDLEHPCQALADFYTIIEKKGDLKGLKLAFIGDGNNVAHSLMLLAAKVGANFAIGCPKGYEPDPKVVEQATAAAKETGATVEVLNDALAAAKDADVIYTDVWASMGQEAEAEERARIFAPFQVNAELMVQAKPDAIFEHCLPAHRGSEVTDEVIDSAQSVVFDEAENRLHVQKAVMVLLST